MNEKNNKKKLASNDSPENTTNPASPPKRSVLPKTTIGWWALGASVVGISSWVVLPVIRAVFRDAYPITNTWVMPAIGTALLDVAAILNVLVIWRRREQSVLNIVAPVLVILMALLFTFIVVGESISGAQR